MSILKRNAKHRLEKSSEDSAVGHGKHCFSGMTFGDRGKHPDASIHPLFCAFAAGNEFEISFASVFLRKIRVFLAQFIPRQALEFTHVPLAQSRVKLRLQTCAIF